MKSEPQQPILSSMKYSGVFARGAAMKRRGNSKGFRRIGFCAPHCSLVSGDARQVRPLDVAPAPHVARWA
jgi:hypothetical protein